MNTFVISVDDVRAISAFLDTYRPFLHSEVEQAHLLRAKLAAAVIVPSRRLPRAVVSMFSTVKVVDLVRRESFTHTLVYPADLREYRSDLSLLTPLGAALIGAAEGAIIGVESSSGVTRDEKGGATSATMHIAVKEVLHQPEWEQRNRFAQDGPVKKEGS